MLFARLQQYGPFLRACPSILPVTVAHKLSTNLKGLNSSKHLCHPSLTTSSKFFSSLFVVNTPHPSPALRPLHLSLVRPSQDIISRPLLAVLSGSGISSSGGFAHVEKQICQFGTRLLGMREAAIIAFKLLPLAGVYLFCIASIILNYMMAVNPSYKWQGLLTILGFS
jgi:hypothetical protein